VACYLLKLSGGRRASAPTHRDTAPRDRRPV